MQMRIVDERLLREFRGPGHCEFCGRWFSQLDAAHVFARGMGSGSRLDVPENLVSLDRYCHTSHHDGLAPMRCDLLAVIAAREGCLQHEIEAYIRLLQRLPRGSEIPAAVLRED